MTSGSVFTGADTRISLKKKGSVRTDFFDARVTGISVSGFDLNITPERTHRGYFDNYKGISNGVVSINYVLDVGSTSLAERQAGFGVQSMSSFIGSTSVEGNQGVLKSVLEERESVKYKIGIENIFYNGNFGNLTNSSTVFKTLFYNSKGVTNTVTVASDASTVGVLTFGVLPFDVSGRSNYLEITKTPDISLGSFNSVETEYDVLMGYNNG
jgi:hypothetical protein